MMRAFGVQAPLAPEAVASGDSWMWDRGGSRGGAPEPPGSGPSPEEIRAQLDAARKPVLRDRAKIAVGSVILITIVFLAMAVAAGNPTGWPPQLVRIANLIVVLSAWGFLAKDRSVEAIEMVVLGAVGFSCVCSGIVSTLESDPMNAALGLFAVTLGTATFLPWRARMQVALVVIAGLTLAGNFLALDTALHFTTAISIVTVLGTFVASVYMVRVLEDLRRRGIIGDVLRRRAEEDLRLANDALERRVEERTTEVRVAMHELESFNYSVSHDLRSPLRVINGMTQLIEEEFAGQLDEQSTARFGRVKLATRRLGELMDAMLARSRVAQAEMRRTTVDLSELGDAVLVQLRSDHPERAVVWTRPPRLPASGDPKLLRLLLENLLDNAWKFTRSRETASIELGQAQEGSAGELFVRDNGVGFDMSHASRLFENFQRFHGDEYEGHGMGLAMARRIIERHGGSIRAESKPGAGTTIYFTAGQAPKREPA